MTLSLKYLLDLLVDETVAVQILEEAASLILDPNVLPVLEDCRNSHLSRQNFIQAKLGSGQVDANAETETESSSPPVLIFYPDDKSAPDDIVAKLVDRELGLLDKYKSMSNSSDEEFERFLQTLFIPEQNRCFSKINNLNSLLKS